MAEIKKALYIDGARDGYSPDQCRTCTIGDLICALEEYADAYGEDTEVFLRNDNGYTYGGIDPWEFLMGGYDNRRTYIDGEDGFDLMEGEC